MRSGLSLRAAKPSIAPDDEQTRPRQQANEDFKGILGKMLEEQRPTGTKKAMADVVDVHLARAFHAQFRQVRNLPGAIDQAE
jgi:hypothetical protein